MLIDEAANEQTRAALLVDAALDIHLDCAIAPVQRPLSHVGENANNPGISEYLNAVILVRKSSTDNMPGCSENPFDT